ncbi:hypothetical protein [Wohlfahrtiimonas populi]|uniref:hypothetical protein n=1 Tax=Wohlfahrtiimonas populi TaxID=1940240 RepID=UPI00098D5262|nr:hypothetical protein [Wohlfahrtiimonas populi]
MSKLLDKEEFLKILEQKRMAKHIDENEFLKIMREEELPSCSWYQTNGFEMDQIGIIFENGKWKTFVTSERCAILDSSVSEFDNESDALNSLLFRLRARKRIIEKNKTQGITIK